MSAADSKPRKLEFLLPGSPTDAFFSQFAFFRSCLDHLGGEYRDARLVGVLGADEVVPVPLRWEPYLERVEIRHLPVEIFRERGILGTAIYRYELLNPEADVSFLCDADTAILRPLPDQFLAEMTASPAVSGVVAHYSPPILHDSRGTDCELYPGIPQELAWERLGDAILGRALERPLQYTLATGNGDLKAPFYVNHGFVGGTPGLLDWLRQEVEEIQPRVSAILQSFFSAQVSLALAIQRGGLPWRALPMRYNFPNDPEADRRYPEELEQIRVLHFLRTDNFDRQKIFQTAGAFEEFLALDLEGSDRVFQDHVREVTGGAYPFPVPAAVPAAVVSEKPAPRCIMVCGARRTGTSLVAALLSADDETPPFPGEAQLLPRWLDSYAWAQAHFSYRAAPFFGDEARLRDFYRDVIRSFLKHCVSHFDGARTFVLKSPELALYLPELCELMPDAPLVLTVRDPRDQVASEWGVLQRRGGAEDERVLAARDFQGLASGYVRYYERVLPILESQPDRVHLIRFEDLVTNPDRELTRLAAHVDLDLSAYDPAADWPRIGESFRAFEGAPAYSELYGKAIDPGRVGAHRGLMSPEEARQVMEVCAEAATRFGYPSD